MRNLILTFWLVVLTPRAGAESSAGLTLISPRPEQARRETLKTLERQNSNQYLKFLFQRQRMDWLKFRFLVHIHGLRGRIRALRDKAQRDSRPEAADLLQSMLESSEDDIIDALDGL